MMDIFILDGYILGLQVIKCIKIWRYPLNFRGYACFLCIFIKIFAVLKDLQSK